MRTVVLGAGGEDRTRDVIINPWQILSLLCLSLAAPRRHIPDVTLTQLDGYLGSTLKYAANV